MNKETISWFLTNIPSLLQYFVPGYLSLMVFLYFTSKKIAKDMHYTMSFVLSYVLLSLTSIIRPNTIILSKIPDSPIGNSFIAIILGILLSVLASLIFSSKQFSRLNVSLFRKTQNEDIWLDILDLKNGSNLKVYFKSKDYYIIGHHKSHEEKGNESWMAISGFGKFNAKTNKPIENEPSYLDNTNVIYAVRLSDIEHIEIF